MGTQNFRAADIKGLTPAIEASQSNDLFVLDGKNYLFDSKGPRSGFGSRALTQIPFGVSNNPQGFRVRLKGRSRCFTFTDRTILEWSESAGSWRVIYITVDTSAAPNRWTWGYLNGKLYMCHPSTGILVYDVDGDYCKPHDGPGVPTQAMAVTVNNGFLVVMTPTVTAWSAPSNGMDFTPTLGGAGFQVISDRVSGYPIAITSYTQGCLTWTTGGVMRSAFTGESTVFQHRALQIEYQPINSFCTCRVDDDSVIIADRRGLFQTKGDSLQPYAPVFSEYLSTYIQNNQLDQGFNIRVEWDELQRRLYVSTSLSYADPNYENCFVLYPNVDKWGQFSSTHRGILPIYIESGSRKGDYYGAIGPGGRVSLFMDTPSRESALTNSPTSNLYQPLIQKPPQYDSENDFVTLSSSGIASSIPTSQMTGVAGYYPMDGVARLTGPLTGLDSKISIGMFRGGGDIATDQLAEVVNIQLKSTLDDVIHYASGDLFNTIPTDGTEYDLSQLMTPVDYNLEKTTYVNHKLTLIGTVDAKTQFDIGIPKLVGFVKGSRYYSCSVTGLWHILVLEALDVGESYHLEGLEITATSAGRLL